MITETQKLDTKDCINPIDVAHELSESVMPAKAAYRKSKTFVLAIAAGALIALLSALVLLYISGLVSASEIAFFSLTPSEKEEVEEE